jgi:leader peptidase (prepilin peptidase)/N-methyltransferase
VGIGILIRQRRGKDTPIAFGPFLAIAGWLAMMFGHDLINRYLGLFASNS